MRVVTVESVGELRRLAAIAAGLGRRQPILLRAAVTEAARLERVRLVGDDGAGKFGMDAADLRVAAAEAVASAWLEPVGLHAFGASNVLDAAALAAHVDATVDGGGGARGGRGLRARGSSTPAAGSGSRTSPTRTPLDLGALGHRLDAVAAGSGRRPGDPRPRASSSSPAGSSSARPAPTSPASSTARPSAASTS